jgi:hypothetical protein
MFRRHTSYSGHPFIFPSPCYALSQLMFKDVLGYDINLPPVIQCRLRATEPSAKGNGTAGWTRQRPSGCEVAKLHELEAIEYCD